MKTSLKFTLPIPISANRYWRTTRRGQIYVSAEAKIYKAEVATVLYRTGFKRLEGEIELDMQIYRARRSGDIDNFCKVLIDSLQGTIIADDKQIVKICAERFDDRSNPRVEVVIRERF